MWLCNWLCNNFHVRAQIFIHLEKWSNLILIIPSGFYSLLCNAMQQCKIQPILQSHATIYNFFGIYKNSYIITVISSYMHAFMCAQACKALPWSLPMIITQCTPYSYRLIIQILASTKLVTMAKQCPLANRGFKNYIVVDLQNYLQIL